MKIYPIRFRRGRIVGVYCDAGSSFCQLLDVSRASFVDDVQADSMSLSTVEQAFCLPVLALLSWS